jgi:uncharacterized protein DUF4388
MALTGHLSDLSLSELIEFFCNQRKTGRLKVLYTAGPGYFYLQTGSVIDARLGVLRGIDAVYYALTLPNAKFEFSGAVEPLERTINQPWTQVVLEGLRRLDERIVPAKAFPPGYVSEPDPFAMKDSESPVEEHHHHPRLPQLFSFVDRESVTRSKPLLAGGIAAAIVFTIAAVGIPAGWYNRPKPALAAAEPEISTTATPAEVPAVEEPTKEEVNEAPVGETANAVVRRSRVKRNRDLLATGAASPVVKAGPKRVTVTVNYDEAGRVTQASGNDATALRIARQKRFPAGKPGSATVTIPMN